MMFISESSPRHFDSDDDRGSRTPISTADNLDMSSGEYFGVLDLYGYILMGWSPVLQCGKTLVTSCFLHWAGQ